MQCHCGRRATLRESQREASNYCLQKALVFCSSECQAVHYGKSGAVSATRIDAQLAAWPENSSSAAPSVYKTSRWYPYRANDATVLDERNQPLYYRLHIETLAAPPGGWAFKITNAGSSSGRKRDADGDMRADEFDNIDVISLDEIEAGEEIAYFVMEIGTTTRDTQRVGPNYNKYGIRNILLEVFKASSLKKWYAQNINMTTARVPASLGLFFGMTWHIRDGLNTLPDPDADLKNAIISGNNALAIAAINAGADVNAVDDKKWTPLHIASFIGRVAIVKALIEAKADINAVNIHGQTPLHRASLKGHVAIVEALIAAGANANAANDVKWTPLHLASFFGHVAVIRTLIAARADVNAVDKDKWTPLHLASIYGHVAILRALIEAGANVNAVDADKSTPLHLASIYGHEAVVKALIVAGANVNAVDDLNETSLHKFMLTIDQHSEAFEKYGRYGIIKALVRANINVHIVSNRFQSASDILVENVIMWASGKVRSPSGIVPTLADWLPVLDFLRDAGPRRYAAAEAALTKAATRAKAAAHRDAVFANDFNSAAPLLAEILMAAGEITAEREYVLRLVHTVTAFHMLKD